jgi:hypothetical protein
MNKLDAEDARPANCGPVNCAWADGWVGSLFVLVLMAALFVYHIAHDWPQHMVLWLRGLGGKLGLASDLDGPYILLAGISAVFVAATTLSFAAHHPFPRAGGTCG